MALSRAMKECLRSEKKPATGTKSVEGNKASAKGKTTKQYMQTGPKATGPNYRKGFPGVVTYEGDLK